MNRIDQPERLAEFDATIEYHEAQQRMMNEYLAHWRTAERGELFRVPVRTVGAGELGRCFGFSIPD